MNKNYSRSRISTIGKI